MPSEPLGIKDALAKARRISAGPKMTWKTKPNLADRFTDRPDVKVRRPRKPRHKKLGVVRQAKHIKSLAHGGVRAYLDQLHHRDA